MAVPVAAFPVWMCNDLEMGVFPLIAWPAGIVSSFTGILAYSNLNPLCVAPS